MGKSDRVTSSQDAAISRLVAECRELGTDAPAWQAHLLQGLLGLTSSSTATTGPLPAIGAYAITVAEQGWPSESVRDWFHEWSTDPRNLAEQPALWRFLHLPDEALTLIRRQLVDDREWAACPFVQDHLRPVGLDDGILARVSVPAASVAYNTVVMRPEGSRPFSARDGCLVALLHDRLAPHLGRSILVTTQPNLGRLSTRLRELISCLLRGDSEAQAARQMGLRPSTVHDYVKRLYLEFEVNSRPELLAYFLRAAGPIDELDPAGLSPRLADLLRCLLRGDSEKEAAVRLNLRPASAHQYTKQIYRHFNVQSRAELLALFLRRDR